MMFDAESRAVFLAEQQMESERWRVPDADESDLACACHVCAAPLVPTPMLSRHGSWTVRKVTKGTRLCPSCIQHGWRNTPCVSCGGVTRTWNWSSSKRGHSTRGLCQICRDELHREVAMPSGGAARYAEVA